MEEIATGGDYGSDEQMFVYLYPNKSGDDNECENALANALQYMGEQLLDWGAITYYSIRINYDHPNLSASDRGELLSKFKSWCKNNGYDLYKGAHLNISGQIYNGKSRGGDYDGNSSFARWNPAVMGTGYGVKELLKNGVIHETLHSFISDRITGVENKIDDTEHDLGKVFYPGETTPMSTAYENKHGPHGSCSNDAPFGQLYVTDLTHCTKDSVTLTADRDT